MTFIKQFTAILFVWCITGFAFAATILDSPGQKVSSLSTNPVMVKNWPSVMKELTGNYGGAVVETKSTDEMQKIAAKNEPSSYIATIGAMQLFSITNQPTPGAMQAQLLDIFGDLKSENFDEYDFGMTLMATKVGASNYSVTAILLKNKDKVAQSSGAMSGMSIALNDEITLMLPVGTEILTKNKKSEEGVTAEIYNLRVITSGKNTRDFVTSKLSDAGVAYEESSFLSMTNITVSADNVRATLSFDADSAVSKNNVATLSISRVD